MSYKISKYINNKNIWVVDVEKWEKLVISYNSYHEFLTPVNASALKVVKIYDCEFFV